MVSVANIINTFEKYHGRWTQIIYVLLYSQNCLYTLVFLEKNIILNFNVIIVSLLVGLY